MNTDNNSLRTENENLRARITDLVTTLGRIKATTGYESDTWEGVAGWMSRQATYALARFAADESAKHPDILDMLASLGNVAIWHGRALVGGRVVEILRMDDDGNESFGPPLASGKTLRDAINSACKQGVPREHESTTPTTRLPNRD